MQMVSQRVAVNRRENLTPDRVAPQWAFVGCRNETVGYFNKTHASIATRVTI